MSTEDKDKEKESKYDVSRVNSNTETTYGVLKRECIVNDKSR